MVTVRYRLGLLLILAFCLHLSAMEAVQIRQAHPCVRPGHLFQADLSVPGLDGEGYRLEARIITDMGELHAGRQEDLAAVGLAEGVRFSWVAEIYVPVRWCHLEVVVTDALGTTVAAVKQDLHLWPLVVQRFADLAEGHPGMDRDPRVRLWCEQGALQISDHPGVAATRNLLTIMDRLTAWTPTPPTAPVVGDNELVLVDDIDGGVQPWRLHLPPPEKCLVLAVVFRSGYGWRKDRWPTLPSAWTTAAARAGVVLVEVYPAGDRWWHGCGPRRTWQVLRALRGVAPQVMELPVVGVGIGNGMAGGLRLGGDAPEIFKGLLFIEPALDGLRTPTHPPVQADEQAYLQTFYAIDRGAPQVAQLPGLVWGQTDGGAVTALASLHLAGAEYLETVIDPGSPALWEQVIGMTRSPAPGSRRFRVWGPGRYGHLVVTGMNRWCMPGEVIVESTQHRILASGIAGVFLDRTWQGDPPQVLGTTLVDTIDTPAGRKGVGRPLGPLGAFGRRPFVVVYGTGYHLLAQERNLALTRSFIRDWAAYTQGEPPIVTDKDFDERRYPGHDLVVVGSSLSNSRLTDLIPDLPITWTERNLTVVGQTLQARDLTGLICAWPHRDGHRLVVVLDGDPVWEAGDGHPFFGLGDLVLVRQDGTRLHRVFDNGWLLSGPE